MFLINTQRVTGLSMILMAGSMIVGTHSYTNAADTKLPNNSDTQQIQPEYVLGEVIIKFDRIPDAQLLNNLKEQFPKITSWRSLLYSGALKSFPKQTNPLSYYRVANVPKNTDIPAFARTIAKAHGVVSASPNGITHLAFIPNDARYNEQWGPQKIRSEEAWDITLGDSSIIIAEADTGINFNHEDLSSAIWANDDPVNGRDDDNNGFIDDFRGWDFIDNDNDPSDGNGHGSHTAGTAAARTNNTVGMAGMAQSTIMPLGVFNAAGSGTFEAIAEAIVYATDNGASVLNYSGGGLTGAPVLKDAVTFAWDNGMTVVVAAGNFGLNLKFFPAAYPETIAVAATDRNDKRAVFSEKGNWLDVAAPGVDILSSYKGASNSYEILSGTSMAAPHVTGLVALMYALDPTLSPQNVRDLLQQNAKDLGTPGFDKLYGWGRIDAAATLAAIGGPADCLTVSLDQLISGQMSTWKVTGGAEGEIIALVFGFNNTPQTINNQFGFCATFGFNGINQTRFVALPTATIGGQAVFMRMIPGGSSGIAVRFQAAQQNTCPAECMSNIIDAVVQ